MTEPTPATRHDRTGLLAIFGAYGIWGLFPLYFAALAPAGAWEILAHRIMWSLLTCVVVIGLRGGLPRLVGLLHSPATLLGLVVAALLIAVNWVVYVWAVLAGRTTEAALGYFLNPLVTVALGVLVLHERLRRLQWVAVGVGVLAAGYLTVAAGGLPWPSLVLALSFAGYGLAKKRIGATLTPWESLAGETAVLVPVAVGVLALLGARGETTVAGHGALHTALLVAAGVVTAVPLLLFAAAARRIPLAVIGLVQFLTPVMQLLVGVLLLHEHMSAQRWAGFAIVWVALVVLTADSLLAVRRARALTRSAGSASPRDA